MFCALSFFSTQQVQALEPELWKKLREGTAVALLRHAIAPGNGDPVGFVVDDCTTQRNLSAEGRAQSQRIGDALKAESITQAAVYSSQWCRCIDTGYGLDLGTIETLPLLNSFYQDRSTESDQTDTLKKWIKRRLENTDTATILPAILVSHQVNITSLTGVFPSSGELVLVTYDNAELVVLGTVSTE